MSAKNFQVIDMVGKGSFATVYKVIRKSDNKVYAMKRVKINKMSRKEIADALNEVRFLSSIHHPNIVGFYEAFLENNDTELCIIMDFCSCGDLSQKVERYKRRRQYIQEAKIWSYLIQALRALQTLHSQSVLHRDIKAANTFLSEDGSIKIGDMNVSKRMKQGGLHTQIGTPYYMSPEIWNNFAYDERSDIWSLGCMIYELAALRPPFLGDSFPALKKSVVMGRYPPLPRTFSDSLGKVVGMMLRVSASQRPKAGELLSCPEILAKINQLDFPDQHQPKDVKLMNTIKVPQALKRLNEQLPKACYPSLQAKVNDENAKPLFPLPSAPPTVVGPPASIKSLAPLPLSTEMSRKPLSVMKHHPNLAPIIDECEKSEKCSPRPLKPVEEYRHMPPRPPMERIPAPPVASQQPNDLPRVRFQRRLW